ncbi:CIC11C00000000094 [Sungouiella intermedia]|uniref:Protein DML1 n=1 Tax=Sungouiella intermedia TaxID=45354 RepID=A0A1L0C421_9ASCO|nr:CIC11C00000000094 [[Candida] intermedia]
MHEVISLSCSQRSGHLLTHLYNEQESHIPYSKDVKLSHSNDVFLWPIRAGGKNNYYPRSINFEYSGGFGFLSRFEYHEPKVDLSKLEGVHLSSKSRVEKNEFQQNLDNGTPTDNSLLNVNNTKYWTDYNKLIYRPQSLVELENFEYPEGKHKHFQKLTFQNYQYGEQEFKLLFDVCDDAFRKNLEGLDNIQGINFFSEVDNAWGGFTNEMIVQLKDEYFNNGVNSKYNLWCYGLLSPKENPLTRIKSIIELSKSSTLFIPLRPVGHTSFLNENFDKTSLWHQGAAQSLFVDSIWGLNSQLENLVRMAEIEANILQGFSQRNIVNEISLTEDTRNELDKSAANFGIVSDVNIMDMYLSVDASVSAKGTDAEKSDQSLSLGFSTPRISKKIGKSTIISKSHFESEDDVYVNRTMDHITELDTFPSIIDREYQVEFGQSASLKESLKEYRKIIQRVRLPAHFEIIGEKSELIEDISTLIEEYTTGYEDESDWDDD